LANLRVLRREISPNTSDSPDQADSSTGNVAVT
jgi:hypothetical protein